MGSGRRLWFVGALTLAACAVLGWWWSYGRAEAEGVVAREPVRRVAALGRIEPAGRVLEIGANVGRIGKLMVEEGDVVKAGQVLAELQDLASKEAAVKQARGTLADARRRQAAEVAQREAEHEEARAKLAVIGPTADLQIGQQKVQVELAEARVERAKKDAERVRSLSKTLAASVFEADNLELDYLVRKLECGVAKAELALLISNKETDIRVATARVQSAASLLAVAKESVDVARLEAEVAEAVEDAELSRLVAPSDGTVLKVYRRPGARMEGGQVMDLGDMRKVDAVAEVDTADIQRVKVGQKAVITGAGLSQTLTGRVREVGSMVYKNKILSIDPVAAADVRVVEVRVALDEPGKAERLTHLQVDVMLMVEEGAQGDEPRVGK